MTTPKTTKKVTTPEKLPANPFLFEVFDLVEKQRSNAKKVEVLQEYKDPSMMAIFIWNYDPSLESAIPSGDVPFADAREIGVVGNDTTFSDSMNKQLKTDEMLDSYGSNNRTAIRKEYNNFHNFIRGGNDSLSGIRREAEIVCLVKDKRLQDRYKISFDVVKEAFPEIQWGDRV
jgi:hypothetical protein